MSQIIVPDYDGRSLVNLVAELEHRLTGKSASPRLAPELRDEIGDADTFVFVLFDGLGSRQLDHPNAVDLAEAHRGDIDAPFPYTTTVSLASVATGLPPSRHGLIAYQLWMEEIGRVVNTIHMTTLWGEKLDFDYDSLLPSPNLCERLRESGKESIVIQPGYFDRTPLTRALYRGARFEPYWSVEEAIDVTVGLASEPGRLVFLYIPHIDFAAHVAGQASEAYTEAMQVANNVWGRLSERLADDVSLVGTADHGHIDIAEERKIRLPSEAQRGLTLYGAERAVFVKGDGAFLADGIAARWVPRDQLPQLWGPAPVHAEFESRMPDGILFADDGYAIFHKHSNDRLVGYHGGLMPEEREIPLLVRAMN
ncbi:MAG: alkaline phosphatase family protein [Actinomycetota bacterium]|nr:alkaline phosphatase family protein [Actinomycetota bacterium]MDK1292426.1 alkaline phosphatase family protein [Actinomycetota bacterium]